MKEISGFSVEGEGCLVEEKEWAKDSGCRLLPRGRESFSAFGHCGRWTGAEEPRSECRIAKSDRWWQRQADGRENVSYTCSPCSLITYIL